jgi:hypothetical protein
MAKVTRPTKSAKPESSQPVIALASLDKHEPVALTPMNFRVPETFHREFKLYAVQHGMSMVDLLQDSFRLLKAQRGH